MNSTTEAILCFWLIPIVLPGVSMIVVCMIQRRLDRKHALRRAVERMSVW